MNVARFAHLGLAATVALAVGACSRPDPPTLAPRSATITSVSSGGFGMDVTLDAYNPNRIGLSARSVTATITLDGRLNLGEVTSRSGLELPAQKTTTLVVPMAVKWPDLAGIAQLALAKRDIPYKVEGKVEMGGDALSVNVPFQINGIMTHAQLVQATLDSLPKIPGFQRP